VRESHLSHGITIVGFGRVSWVGLPKVKGLLNIRPPVSEGTPNGINEHVPEDTVLDKDGKLDNEGSIRV
jgi:hypothetical protein